MADLNELFDELLDRVADRVVAKLRASEGSDWPGAVETKEEVPEAVEHTPEALPEPERDYRAERLDHWTDYISENGRSAALALLKEHGEDLRSYSKLGDLNLISKLADFEILTGRELDDATEEDIAEPEAEDVELPALTRESAVELDLPDLKDYAVKAGIAQEDLNGLDVDAIADLLFGESEQEDLVTDPDGTVRPPDSTDMGEYEGDDDVVELDEDEIRDASLAQLKQWAKEFGIEYQRNISRNDLIELILAPEEE